MLNLNGSTIKKVTSIVSAVIMGVVAVANSLSDQKKSREFEEMKKTLAELKKES